jgi:hypothetical protein
LQFICEEDDNDWYKGLGRRTIKQLWEEFEIEAGYPSPDISVEDFITEIQVHLRLYFRRVDPVPAQLNKNSTLGGPCEIAWNKFETDQYVAAGK